MKTKTLLAMGLCAAIGPWSFTADAAKPARGSQDAEHIAGAPATLEGIRAKLFDQHRAFHDAVRSNAVAEAHAHLSLIRSLAEASLGKITAADRPYVYGTVTNIAGLTDELERATDSANPAAVQIAHGKLDATLKTLETELVRARPLNQPAQYQGANTNRVKRYAAPRRHYYQPRIIRPQPTKPPRLGRPTQPPQPPVKPPVQTPKPKAKTKSKQSRSGSPPTTLAPEPL